MKDGGLYEQQKAEMDLTRAEKEALLFMLRKMRDDANDLYDTGLDALRGNGLSVSDFCTGWDKLKL
jgi:hypothetical protein